jgi:7-cyano-7-deazaguanine synthase
VPNSTTKRLLLHSGGLDSTCLAVRLRPEVALTIDYGQLSAHGEIRAAQAICDWLGIEHHVLSIDCREIGSGLLAGSGADPHAPIKEWWPYRNQLLVTLGCSWGLPRDIDELILGSVSTDSRHRDGTPEFYELADQLVRMQEGGLSVTAPAIGMDSITLLRETPLPNGLLGFTHSCHTSDFACGLCPGCLKREQILEAARRNG